MVGAPTGGALGLFLRSCWARGWGCGAPGSGASLGSGLAPHCPFLLPGGGREACLPGAAVGVLCLPPPPPPPRLWELPVATGSLLCPSRGTALGLLASPLALGQGGPGRNLPPQPRFCQKGQEKG